MSKHTQEIPSCQIFYALISKSKLQQLLGYEIDYAGGMAAQMLAHIHLNLCPDEAANLYDNQLKPLGYRMENLAEVDPPSIEDIRNATIEVHALLDAFLDGLAAKRYLVNRLAAFLELYKREFIFSEVKDQDKEPCLLYMAEETVFRPLVVEFLFSNGYYPLSEAQLGHDHLREDILALAPEQDAWFLYELKQCGFGKTPKVVTAVAIEQKLREAALQAARYHRLLEPLKTVQPDVYVVCFVKGVAQFEDGNDPESAYWHHILRGRAWVHLRLVNLQPPGHRGQVLLVRASRLNPTAGKGAA